MNFKEVQELIRLIGKSNLSEFKMKDGEFEISVRTDKYTAGKPQIITQTAPMMPAPVAASEPVAAPVAAPAPASAAPAKAAAEEDMSKYIAVKSPMVGTFYRSSSPDKPVFIKIGDTIEKGTVVCIVEAMKLFNEIESEVSGKVVKILVEDSQPVEYDQPLFLVDPKG